MDDEVGVTRHPAPLSPARDARKAILIGVGLVLITFLVFSPLLHAGFINYDDPSYVTANPHVVHGLTWSGAEWAWTSSYLGAYYPLTLMSYMVDSQVFGSWPGGYHLTNIVFHIGSVLLLFAFLLKASGARWRSLLVALLFAIHPLHVESVAWIAERKDVLSTFFFMLMLFLYVSYVRKPGALRYLAVLGSFLLGLLSKPMLVTAPFVLLLLDFWPLRRFSLHLSGTGAEGETSGDRGPGLKPLGRLVWEKVPFFVLSAAFSLLTYAAQGAGGALGGYPMKGRLVNALGSYGIYLGKTAIPVNLGLLYPFRYHHLPVYQALLTGVLIMLTLVLAFRWRGKAPYLMTGLLWYLGTLVPVIGIVEIGSLAMADRYTYIPLVGIFVILAWGVGDWLLTHGTVFTKKVAAVSLVLWLSALGLLAYRQCTFWRNSLTIWGHTLAVTEANPHAENQYALALMHRGRWEEAEGHLKTAISLLPDYANAWSNLAFDSIMLKKTTLAVASLRQLAGLRPQDPTPRVALARLLSQAGKNKEAREVWREVLRLDPANTEAARAMDSTGASKN